MKNTSITLDQGYIDQVKQNVTPHWGELGWVTYKRTYARWLPEKNRSENWDETVKRVIEGNINLDPRLKDSPSTEVVNELTNEAKDLFKLVYGLGATPSGRN
ncbi:MAG: ribonucleoside-triphosphate reductase, adenosylcobalamin-dependent, partial [Lactobacillus sp.]|nr:ribonucleoside-triphosphate reductase, adenosylcobalamin-dependent [Lactobacillus sp.]